MRVYLSDKAPFDKSYCLSVCGVIMKENNQTFDLNRSGNSVPDAEQFARENPGHVDEQFLDNYTRGLMDLNEQLSDNFQDSDSAEIKIVL